MKRAFRQVDVFSLVPLLGNPVAVVLNGRGLSGEQMQAVANWTNLSETTFVLPATVAGADYQLRIFTPVAEIPFAGHPTLGSAHAVLEVGTVKLNRGQLVQQCKAGLVTIRAEPDGRLSLKAPPASVEPVSSAERRRLERLLGTAIKSAPAVVDLGPRWLTAEIDRVETVLSLTPDMAGLAAFSRDLGITGANVFAWSNKDVEVRSFAPASGVPEDPVCGSGNAAVAAYLYRAGLRSGYTAHQGRCVRRDGVATIEFEENGVIWLGGHSTTCVAGTITI